MTRTVLVEAFMEGASLGTLAKLLGETPENLEHGFRQGLIEIRDGSRDQPVADAPLAERAAATAPRQARNGADSSSGRPARHAGALKRSPARKRMAVDVTLPDGTTVEYSTYPAALHDPRAETQRAIWDALKSGEKTTTMLSAEIGHNSSNVVQAIQKMRNKNLVRGSETTPVKWRQA